MLKKTIILIEAVVLFLASVSSFGQTVSGPNKADAGSAQCYYFNPSSCTYGSGVCWNVGGASYTVNGLCGALAPAKSSSSPSKVVPNIPPGGCSCSAAGAITVTMPSVSTLTTITVGATGQCCSGNSVTVTVVPPLINNVTVSPSSQSVNCNVTPTVLSASTPSGGDGTYSYVWQSSPNNSTWTTIGGATASTYAPPVGSTAGIMYYHVIVTSFDYTVTSAAASVTVATPALSGGTISNASQAINYNTIPATLNCSAASGGSCNTVTYNYLWYSSTDSANWSSTGATGQNYSPGALTATTYYKRLSTISGGPSAYSNVAKVIVYPQLVSGTVSPSSQAINYNTAPATLSVSGTSGGNGAYSYQWQSSPDNTFNNPANVGSNSPSFSPPQLTAPIYYHVVVSSNGVNVTSNSAYVNVYPQLLSGSISPASQTINYNTIPATLSISTASGGNGSYSYQWMSCASSNGTYSQISGATSTSYTPSTGLTATTWYEVVTSSNGVSVTSAPVPVYVRLIGGTINGPSSPIPFNQTASLTSSQDAGGGNCLGSYNYQWFQSLDGVSYQPITGATGNTYTTGNLINSTWFLRRVICNTDTAWSNAALVNVIPPLIAGTITPASLTLPSGTSPGLLTVTPATGGSCNGQYAYQWQSSSDGSNWGNIGSTSLSYSPGNLNATIFYRVQVTCGTGTVYSSPMKVTIGAPPASLNYIRVRTLSKPGVTDTVTADALTSLADVQQTTQYLDGLGRPVQTVIKQASPMGYDLVVPQVYDLLGREMIRYLPYASPSADGNYKPDPIGEQSSFNSTQFPGEQFYYSQIAFEPSPLNRVSATYAPGNNLVGGNKGKSAQYLINTVADSVRIWTISSASGSLPFSTGMYGTGMLYKTIATDEQNHQVIEYIDLLGHTILKKVQSADNPGTAYTGWINTYYVYDTLQNLRSVLQPRAVELINGSWTITQSISDELCFRYEYDARHRLIVKKIPGAGATVFVYDVRNRQIMTQDSTTRSQQKWMFIRYDGMNRPDSSGLITDPANYNNPGYHQNLAATSTSYPTIGSYTSELLTQVWYDDYSWVSGATGALSSSMATTYTNNSNYFITGYNTSPIYAVPITPTAVTRSMVTGGKTKVLGTTNQYLYSVCFYDDRGRVIQTQSLNYTGGVDTITIQYNFSGKALRTLLNHNKAGNTAQNHRVLTKLTYDPLFRLKNIWKNIDGAATDQLIDSIQYNELGQVRAKYLGNKLDSLVYDYNIRGLLTGINKNYVGGTATNYFGMELAYDKTSSIVGTTSYFNALYNGSLTGTIWKSAGDGMARKYDFEYDDANRFGQARYTQNTSGSTWENNSANFSVHGFDADNNYRLKYDANGNILGMVIHGLKGLTSTYVNALRYNYYPNSNKLQVVTDDVNDSATKLGNFHYNPSAKTGTDYLYDGDGSLIQDNNKAIDQIVYNYINLPQLVHMNKKGNVQYVYDASGNKLKKVTTDSASRHSTTTLYLGGFVYQQTDTITSPGGGIDTLQFMGHEEGRARWAYHKYLNGTSAYGWEYDFFEKDYLGNTRILLTQQKDTAKYLASIEAAYRATENALFYNIPTTCVARTSAPGYPVDITVTNPNDSVSRLNGNGPKLGPAIILKVMSGDKVDVGVNYYYNNVGSTNGQKVSPSDLINSLASGIVSVSGGLHGSFSDLTGGSSPLTGALNSFINSNNATASGKPNAYLNWILLDNQFNYVAASSGALPVGSSGTQSGGGLQPPLASSGITMAKSGYLYIYVSNATPGWDVFFDNLSIKTYSGPMLEENHYYPFGLTMAGISDKAVKTRYAENKYRFNAGNELQNKEFSDGTGLELYDAQHRMLDPQLGRFGQIDPLADAYNSISTYSFAADNPVMMLDPNGLSPRPRGGPDPMPQNPDQLPGGPGGSYISDLMLGVQQADESMLQKMQDDIKKDQAEAQREYENAKLAAAIYQVWNTAPGSGIGLSPEGLSVVSTQYDYANSNGEFVTGSYHGFTTFTEGETYMYKGSSVTVNVDFGSEGGGEGEKEGEGLELAAKVYETSAVSYETTIQGINGAQKLANSWGGKALKMVSLESKGVSASLGLVSAGFTIADGLTNKDGWQNHHTADILITGGQVVLAMFEATSPIGWAFGAGMFIGNLISEHYTGKTITENLFDK